MGRSIRGSGFLISPHKPRTMNSEGNHRSKPSSPPMPKAVSNTSAPKTARIIPAKVLPDIPSEVITYSKG